MTMTATRTLIEEIYERERAAAARVRWPADVEDLGDPTARRRVLRSLFRAEVDTVRTFAGWATCPHGVPAARLVLRVQPLLVAIQPMSHEAFVRQHGMTPHAMAELVRAGWLIVNLHAFENDRRRGFPEHERYSGVLGPLLRLETGCRIMYARRDRYFKLLDLTSARIAAAREGREIFREPIRKVLTPEDRRVLVRIASGTARDALAKVCENWSYLVALADGDRDPDLAPWIAEVRERLASVDRDELRRILQDLTAWKHLRVSVQIKAFGGTLLLSARDAAEAFAPIGDGGARLSDAALGASSPRVRRTDPHAPLTADQIFHLGNELASLRAQLEELNDDYHTQESPLRITNAMHEAQRNFEIREREAFVALGLPVPPALAEFRFFPALWRGRTATVGDSSIGSYVLRGEERSNLPSARSQDDVRGVATVTDLNHWRSRHAVQRRLDK